MGTWDEGLLDNDAAHDGLGDITSGVVEDIRALVGKEPDEETTERSTLHTQSPATHPAGSIT